MHLPKVVSNLFKKKNNNNKKTKKKKQQQKTKNKCICYKNNAKF